MHSRWGYAFLVRIYIPGEDMHSRWGYAFPVRTWIPSEDVHSRWECAFPVRMCIPGDDVHSRSGTSPFLVRMFIPLWFILTGNGDVPHRECIPSPGMHIVMQGELFNTPTANPLKLIEKNFLDLRNMFSNQENIRRFSQNKKNKLRKIFLYISK